LEGDRRSGRNQQSRCYGKPPGGASRLGSTHHGPRSEGAAASGRRLAVKAWGQDGSSTIRMKVGLAVNGYRSAQMRGAAGKPLESTTGQRMRPQRGEGVSQRRGAWRTGMGDAERPRLGQASTFIVPQTHRAIQAPPALRSGRLLFQYQESLNPPLGHLSHWERAGVMGFFLVRMPPDPDLRSGRRDVHCRENARLTLSRGTSGWPPFLLTLSPPSTDRP